MRTKELRKWTVEDIPDQSGKTVIVTGANSGIGFETARVLADRGAEVILACRDIEKCIAAAGRIRAGNPSAVVKTMPLNLANLKSVHTFAESFKNQHKSLHLLINNAGVLWTPFTLTDDGFELQFGVNHLGHFALSALLMDNLLETEGSRIITISSQAHRKSRLTMQDMPWRRRIYNRYAAYANSKLANLLFAYELQRKLENKGHHLLSIAAHPGYTATNLQRAYAIIRFANKFIAQPSDMGALPILRAATDPDVLGSDYFGPNGLLGLKGYPVKVRSSTRSRDAALAAELWKRSEQLTGMTYNMF